MDANPWTVTSFWGRFTMIPNEIIQNYMADMGPSVMVTLLAIASFANNDTHQCYPAHDTLAELTGLSVSTVRRAIARLVEMGLLCVSKRTTAHGQTSNLYELTDPRRQERAPADQGAHPRTPSLSTHEHPGCSPMDNELDSSELDDLNYTCVNEGGGGIPPCSSVNKPDTTATAEERHAWEDPDAGWLFDEVLPRAGVMVSSPYAAEAWLDLLELTRDHAFIEEAFQSAAEMGKVPNARYIQAILQRCLEEGRRPGAGKRPKQRDGDLPDGFGTNFKDVF
jgi:DNA-binding MarR family transcriptional regulator